MSQIIEQAEELRARAVALLLQEQNAIEQKLDQLGYAGAETKSRKQVTCGKCGGTGHTARTCPTTPEEMNG